MGELFTGVSAGLIGIVKEMAIPDDHRSACWFSADATPECVGGINWRNMQFFAEQPLEFAQPFLPYNRTRAHINEIEFLAKSMCAVIWSAEHPALIM